MQHGTTNQDLTETKALLHVLGVRNSEILSRTSWHQSVIRDNLTLIGALIVFFTFVIKDAIREGVKDTEKVSLSVD
jgi:hypothetical protein